MSTEQEGEEVTSGSAGNVDMLSGLTSELNDLKVKVSELSKHLPETLRDELEKFETTLASMKAEVAERGKEAAKSESEIAYLKKHSEAFANDMGGLNEKLENASEKLEKALVSMGTQNHNLASIGETTAETHRTVGILSGNVWSLDADVKSARKEQADALAALAASLREAEGPEQERLANIIASATELAITQAGESAAAALSATASRLEEELAGTKEELRSTAEKLRADLRANAEADHSFKTWIEGATAEQKAHFAGLNEELDAKIARLTAEIEANAAGDAAAKARFDSALDAAAETHKAHIAAIAEDLDGKVTALNADLKANSASDAEFRSFIASAALEQKERLGAMVSSAIEVFTAKEETFHALIKDAKDDHSALSAAFEKKVGEHSDALAAAAVNLDTKIESVNAHVKAKHAEMEAAAAEAFRTAEGKMSQNLDESIRTQNEEVGRISRHVTRRIEDLAHMINVIKLDMFQEVHVKHALNVEGMKAGVDSHIEDHVKTTTEALTDHSTRFESALIQTATSLQEAVDKATEGAAEALGKAIEEVQEQQIVAAKAVAERLAEIEASIHQVETAGSAALGAAVSKIETSAAADKSAAAATLEAAIKRSDDNLAATSADFRALLARAKEDLTSALRTSEKDLTAALRTSEKDLTSALRTSEKDLTAALRSVEEATGKRIASVESTLRAEASAEASAVRSTIEKAEEGINNTILALTEAVDASNAEIKQAMVQTAEITGSRFSDVGEKMEAVEKGATAALAALSASTDVRVARLDVRVDETSRQASDLIHARVEALSATTELKFASAAETVARLRESLSARDTEVEGEAASATATLAANVAALKSALEAQLSALRKDAAADTEEARTTSAEHVEAVSHALADALEAARVSMGRKIDEVDHSVVTTNETLQSGLAAVKATVDELAGATGKRFESVDDRAEALGADLTNYTSLVMSLSAEMASFRAHLDKRVDSAVTRVDGSEGRVNEQALRTDTVLRRIEALESKMVAHEIFTRGIEQELVNAVYASSAPGTSSSSFSSSSSSSSSSSAAGSAGGGTVPARRLSAVTASPSMARKTLGGALLASTPSGQRTSGGLGGIKLPNSRGSTFGGVAEAHVGVGGEAGENPSPIISNSSAASSSAGAGGASSTPSMETLVTLHGMSLNQTYIFTLVNELKERIRVLEGLTLGSSTPAESAAAAEASKGGSAAEGSGSNSAAASLDSKTIKERASLLEKHLEQVDKTAQDSAAKLKDILPTIAALRTILPSAKALEEAKKQQQKGALDPNGQPMDPLECCGGGR